MNIFISRITSLFALKESGMDVVDSEFLSVIIALLALSVSIFTFRHSRAATVRGYFTHGDNDNMKQHRAVVYDIYKKGLKEEKAILGKLIEKSDDVSHVVSFYDFWALMVKKHYLPIWAFQASSKYTAINTYSKIKPFIEYRRGERKDKPCPIGAQQYYASHFEWLIDQLQNLKKIKKFIATQKEGYLLSADIVDKPKKNDKLILKRNTDLKEFWFSVDAQHECMKQFKNDPKAYIYFYHQGIIKYKGVKIEGNMEVLSAKEAKEFLEDSVDSQCILKFTAVKGEYSHDLSFSKDKNPQNMRSEPFVVKNKRKKYVS